MWLLMMVLPDVPPLGVRLVAGPMVLVHRMTGYVPRAFRYPFQGDIPMPYEASARQAFFDTVVDQNLADITQFVILGAGFDTRVQIAQGRAGPIFRGGFATTTVQ